DKIIAAANGQDDNKCFFVDGPGGTGKTFLYQTLCYIMNGLGIEILTDEIEFAQWLFNLENRTLPTINEEIEVLQQYISTKSLIMDVFDNVLENEDETSLISTVILCTTNKISLDIYNKVIQKMHGQEKVYLSIDKIICDHNEDPTEFPEKFLYSLTPNGLPPHQLILKQGAVVMLLQNLDVNEGLCNGVRMIIRRMHDHVLDCELMTGNVAGRRVLIPRIKLQPTDDFLPFH
ncbi:19007_t:CDS:2, partial [Dentiscutata erythropus]